MLRKKGFNGFFGMQMYETLVPKNHFLRKVDEHINWIPLIQKITPAYKGQFTLGTSPINPVTLFKMMLLSFLYDRSEREVEIMCDESIPFKYFIEIGIDEKAPDHTSISKFRTRIIKHFKNADIFEEIFEEILAQILSLDVEVGEVQIVDSKHMNARVSQYRKTKKIEEQREKEQEINKNREEEGKDPKDFRVKKEIDPDAGTGCKGTEIRKDKKGNRVEIPKWFFG